MGLGVVLVGLAAWRTLSVVHTDVAQARTTIDSATANPDQLLSTPGRAQSLHYLTEADGQLQQADRQIRTSLSLDVLSWVPFAHTQRDGLLQLVDDARTMTESGSTLLTTVDTLQSESHGTSISIPSLRRLQQEVTGTVTRFEAIDRPGSGLIGPIATARASLDRDNVRLVQLMTRGDEALSYALPFLGADGPRTYFLAAENNAEMRDQGAVLSFAVLHVDNGSFTVGTAQSVGVLALTQPAPVTVPPSMEQVFGGYQPTETWQSTNATANFPWSGADMAAMYTQASGVRPDGVVGIDVPMVASLLTVSGPVSVPGISGAVTSQNLAPIILNQLYDGIGPNQADRSDELSAVAQAAVDAMQGRDVDLARLARVVAQGIDGRHLLVWDADPAYETTVADLGASGSIDTDEPAETFHVAVENATATKLDYYVTVDVSMHITVTAVGYAVVDTTVTLHNSAPANAKPSYQLGPDGVSSTVAGQYVGHVYLWGPLGGTQLGSVVESGLQLSEQDLSVLPQAGGSVNFQTVIPDAVRNGWLNINVVPQPRLVPEQVTATLSAPGWALTGSDRQSAVLTRTSTMSWRLTPAA